MILLSLVRKLIRNVGVLVVGAQDHVLSWRLAISVKLLGHILNSLEVVGVIFAKLRNPKVKCNDLGAAFPRSDFDEVVHEEP